MYSPRGCGFRTVYITESRRLPFFEGCAEMANALGPTDCDAVHPGRINQIVFARRPVRTDCASVGLPSQYITYTHYPTGQDK